MVAPAGGQPAVQGERAVALLRLNPHLGLEPIVLAREQDEHAAVGMAAQPASVRLPADGNGQDGRPFGRPHGGVEAQQTPVLRPQQPGRKRVGDIHAVGRLGGPLRPGAARQRGQGLRQPRRSKV